MPLVVNQDHVLTHAEPFQYCPVPVFLIKSLFRAIADSSDAVPLIVTGDELTVPDGLVMTTAGAVVSATWIV